MPAQSYRAGVWALWCSVTDGIARFCCFWSLQASPRSYSCSPGPRRATDTTTSIASELSVHDVYDGTSDRKNTPSNHCRVHQRQFAHWMRVLSSSDCRRGARSPLGARQGLGVEQRSVHVWEVADSSSLCRF